MQYVLFLKIHESTRHNYCMKEGRRLLLPSSCAPPALYSLHLLYNHGHLRNNSGNAFGRSWMMSISCSACSEVTNVPQSLPTLPTKTALHPTSLAARMLVTESSRSTHASGSSTPAFVIAARNELLECFVSKLQSLTSMIPSNRSATPNASRQRFAW